MRTRVFSSTEGQTLIKAYLQKINGVVVYNYPSCYAFPGSSHRDYMLDEVTPNFQKRSKAGEIINNPMLRVTSTSSAVPMEYYVSGTSGMEQWLWRCVSKPFVPNPQSFVDTYFDSFDSERQAAINAAWANINQEEILLGATVGELPETIKWVASVLGRIAALCRKSTYRRLFTKKLTDNLFTNTGQLWLEWRYAVRPLIFELNAAVKAYNKAIDKSLRYTARGKNIYPLIEDVSYLDVPLANLTIKFQKTVKDYRYYRAGVLYTINGGASELNMLLGLDKPLEVIWELTTLSFVFDWIINIGDIISAHSVSSSYSPLTSWVKEVHLHEEVATNVEAKFNGGDSLGNWNITIQCLNSGSWTKSYRVERRLPDAVRSVMPTFKLKLDLAKVIDLTFILKQMFKK